ncbi:MAG: BON domain-containing protein [Bacteroidota bacterium]
MKPTIRNAAFAVCVLVATPLIASCAATSAQESTGEYIDDAAITAKVKNQLLQDKNVSGLQVTVETYKGRVQLSGFVSSQYEKIKAEKLARGVPGVRSVSNDLIVKAD